MLLYLSALCSSERSLQIDHEWQSYGHGYNGTLLLTHSVEVS